MTGQKPLLSICIPTFNRCDLLDVCLATVLPQVREHADRVECVVSDNCSPDRTSEVISRYQEEYPFRYYRNQTNLGPLVNVVKCGVDLPRGELVWILGDDDTLNVGAVQRVLDFAERPDLPDLVAVNVGYLPEERRPSAVQALGGIGDEPDEVLRQLQKSGILPFEELFEGPCADFTAIYSFVMRRAVWQRHFGNRKLRGYWTNVENTYPHAHAVAHVMPGKEAGLISEPLVTIYELPAEKFSWAAYLPRTALLHATQLLRLYEKRGVDRTRLSAYYEHQLRRARTWLRLLLWDPNYVGGFWTGLRLGWLLKGYRRAYLRVFCEACAVPEAPRYVRIPVETLLRWKVRMWQSWRFLKTKAGGQSGNARPCLRVKRMGKK